MFTGIDHVAIVVNELESAIASYSRVGFTVVRGGKHPIGTHNALIAFADGSYLELIAFTKPDTGHRWQRALAKGSGIVDFCLSTDDLAADVESMRRGGAKIGDPFSLTRDRPDGYHLSWLLATPETPFSGQLPFLIKDDTPRDERVPRARSHRNGAGGIRTLAIAVDDPGTTSRCYRARARASRCACAASRPRSGGRCVHDWSERGAVACVEKREWPTGAMDSRSWSIAVRARPRESGRWCDDA